MAACGRCGKQIEEASAFCPHCGAARQGSVGLLAGVDMRTKLLLGAMGILVIMLCVVVVLLLERPPQESALVLTPTPSPTASPEATQTPTPSPTPTPAPPDFTGGWIASRIEKNTKKVSPYLDTTIGEERMILHFAADGTVRTGNGESPDRLYAVEGDSAFVDYGTEIIGDKEYYGRTRFFFKDKLLYSVYTLDGRDASDYVVFTRVDEQ